MTKSRLDQELFRRGLTSTRSQAESYIKLGDVKVNGKLVTKPGYFVSVDADVSISAKEQYVSRAALKLASVAKVLGVDFTNKVVLDIGSSTGGFTEYALKHGAKKVIAVEVGTNQLHPTLRGNPQIELHENTDFRKFVTTENVDIFLADVSFVSLRQILPNALKLGNKQTRYMVMVKPQFEAGNDVKHKGVIKNDKIRRAILKDFEDWAAQYFTILDKSDSEVAGAKGNRERFYLLKTA